MSLPQGLFDYWEHRSEKNAQVLLDRLLTIEGAKWHYLHGVSDPSKISPDNWVIDEAYRDRPGNKESNFQSSTTQEKIWMSMPIGRSTSIQKAPTLITWGKNDGIFTVQAAEGFKRDIPCAELHRHGPLRVGKRSGSDWVVDA